MAKTLLNVTEEVQGVMPVANGGTGLTSLSTFYTVGGTDVAVSDGGTGASTLTGIVKGNGTSAFTAATAGTDYCSPGATQTLTASRINPRSTTISGPGATPTVASDSYDVIAYTALAAAITSMTTNLTGTPVLGQKLMLGFKDNGTARAITWGASFKSSGVATLLATTVISKQHWVGLMYDGTAWICLAVDSSGY